MSLSALVWSGSFCNPSLQWSMESEHKGYVAIKFPLELTNGWYGKLPCTKFRTFQHRKERGLLEHEFILLKLNDGSVCRVERVGDPGARFNALSPHGSVAQDIARYFSQDELEEANLGTSDMVTEVELPYEFDLMDVLKICRAIQEGEKTSKYTLQVYNCYFFCLAIQVCLTRLVAHWEDREVFNAWLSQVSEVVGDLISTDQTVTALNSPPHYPIVIRLYSALCHDKGGIPDLMKVIESIVQCYMINSGNAPQDMALHINDVLWHSAIGSGLNTFIEEKVKVALAMAFTKGLKQRSGFAPFTTQLRKSKKLEHRLRLTLLNLMALTNVVDGSTLPQISNLQRSPQPADVPRYIKQKSADQAEFSDTLKRVTPEMDFKAPKEGPEEAPEETPEEAPEGITKEEPKETLKEAHKDSERIVIAVDPLVGWVCWMQRAIQWHRLLYWWSLLPWALHHILLYVWGIRVFTLRIELRPCIIIEDRLEDMMRALEAADHITYPDLLQYTKELDALSRNQTAVWIKKPWDVICRFIEQRISSSIFEQLEVDKPMLRIKREAESEIVETISAFQKRVLERITTQGCLVEKVWLGSAEEIQIELKETLSQVWKKIRDDDTIGDLPFGARTKRLINGTVAVEKISNHASRLHAIIIGINDYPKLPKLKGAVADADEIASFLTSESGLRVPLSQIINLRNETATRQNIINSIKSLQSNQSINRGDPILIYYAGHGGARRATEEWKRETGASVVQVIFPFDHDLEAEGLSGSVQCIPVRTIEVLMRQLSKAKGDNITVIFDSGYSTSRVRNPIKPMTGMPDRRERLAEVKRDIPWGIDSEAFMWEGPQPDMKGSHPITRGDNPSHIHLAACGYKEKAWEEDGRGVFTVALLNSIRVNGVDKITYRNLIKSLPSLSSQSPHCYGKHKERILFNSGVPSRGALMIPVEFDEGSNKIILQAGAASGVTTESIWEVYDSVAGNVSLGRFQAYPPSVSTTVLQPEKRGRDRWGRVRFRSLYWAHIERFRFSESPGTRTYARQVGAGVVDELRVYFTPRAKQRIFSAEEINRANPYSIGSAEYDVGYVVHDAEDIVDIAVDLDPEQDAVSFRLCDHQAKWYGVSKLKKRVRVERSAVEEVLFGAAKWKWHLQLKNPDSEDLMAMELVTLGVMHEGKALMYPKKNCKSVSTSGIAQLEVNNERLYGIKLTNRVEGKLPRIARPVHARIYYFDTIDFSIVDMLGDTIGKDTVIEPEQTFTFGNHNKGHAALQFTLSPGERVGLGYIKVFWSTEPLEMGRVGQSSVFDGISRSLSRHRGATREVDRHTKWGAALLTVVKRSSDGEQ